MTDAIARVMFAVTVLLLAPTLAFLYFSSSKGHSEDDQVVAQFEDAFPLVEGMNVRVDGAIAGSVGKISVNDEGIAEVRLLLDEDVESPKADATAAIRQQDTTGDSYVAFEPGHLKKPLHEIDGRPTIACAGDAQLPCPHTLVAPRLDDLLNTFGKQERTGIQLTLTELARAVDGRGKDLNRAALDLRPGLVAANRALADVNQQNDALRAVIADAEAVTSQAASRRTDLVDSIDSLASTLQETSSQTASLDTGLARLPATVKQGRSTMAAVTRTASAARPLATDLLDTAPQLVTAVDRAPGFVTALRSFLVRARPTLELTDRLLKAAAPTIEAGPSRVVTGPFDLAPAISNLLRGVLGEDETIEVLFSEKFGLGAAASEPGNQPGYPADAADRHFMRVTAVLNCEGFGVKIRPGCLLDLLDLARTRDAREQAKARRSNDRHATARGRGRRDADSRDDDPSPSPTPAGSSSAPQASPAAPPQATPAPAPSAPATPAPAPAPAAPSGQQLDMLLDFLLGR